MDRSIVAPVSLSNIVLILKFLTSSRFKVMSTAANLIRKVYDEMMKEDGDYAGDFCFTEWSFATSLIRICLTKCANQLFFGGTLFFS